MLSLFSGLMEGTQPEQIEAGAAIHLPLDQLESVNLSFDRPIVPREMQGGFDGVLVACETGDEAA